MSIRKVLRTIIALCVIITLSVAVLSCTQVTTAPGSTTTAASTTKPPITSPGTTITPAKTTTTTPVSQTDDLSFLIGDDPANIDNAKLPITPLEKIHVTGSPADYDINTYRLTLDGLVDNPLSLTYDYIKQLPAVTQTVLLICPGIFVDNAEWTGVPVTELLDKAGVKDKAFEIIFYDGDQYQKSFFIKDIVDAGAFLAYTVDGQVLPKEHGFPLRLVVKGQFGNTWVKWVNRIEIK